MKPGTTPDDEGTGDMALRAAHFDRNWTAAVGGTPSISASASAAPPPPPSPATVRFVAYRNRSADEVRDIYVSRFTGDAWTVPAPVHDDGWKIDGCPVNGPSISASDRHVAVAWFTAPKDEGHALVAFSRDAGRTFSAPVQVDDTASLGRVDVEQLADGSAVVGWIELAGDARRVQGAAGGTRRTAIGGVRRHRSG